MKHRFWWGLLTLLLLVAPRGAGAGGVAPATLQGLITEVQSGYFLLSDATLGEVRVNLDDTLTRYEGVASEATLAPGQYVYVDYSGVITRSMPPQVTALKVRCFTVSGSVSEILQSGFLVTGDPVLGDVVIHIGEGMPTVYQGVPITVYFSGVMAMSMPPQVQADYLVVPMLYGKVSDVAAESFTLTDSQGAELRVALQPDTRMQQLPAQGDAVCVYYSGQTESDGAIVALEVAAQESVGAAE